MDKKITAIIVPIKLLLYSRNEKKIFGRFYIKKKKKYNVHLLQYFIIL